MTESIPKDSLESPPPIFITIQQWLIQIGHFAGTRFNETEFRQCVDEVIAEHLKNGELKDRYMQENRNHPGHGGFVYSATVFPEALQRYANAPKRSPRAKRIITNVLKRLEEGGNFS